MTCLSDDSSDGGTPLVARRKVVGKEPFVQKVRGALRVQTLSDDECEELALPRSISSGKQRPFVEVFAGSHNLSDAFAASGHQVYPTEVNIRMDHDMHGGSAAELLMRQLCQMSRETGLKPYVHFTPSCSTYSQARFPRIRSVSHPSGMPSGALTKHDRGVLNHANRITRNTFGIMVALHVEGHIGMVSLEQPSTSLMFRTKEFRSWACKSGAAPINVDYCMRGMPCRKRTT